MRNLLLYHVIVCHSSVKVNDTGQRDVVTGGGGGGGGSKNVILRVVYFLNDP